MAMLNLSSLDHIDLIVKKFNIKNLPSIINHVKLSKIYGNNVFEMLGIDLKYLVLIIKVTAMYL